MELDLDLGWIFTGDSIIQGIVIDECVGIGWYPSIAEEIFKKHPKYKIGAWINVEDVFF